MKRRCAILVAAYVAAVASCAAYLAFAARRGVDADLLSLAGVGPGHGLREAADAMEGSAALLFEGADEEAVLKAASAAAAEYGGLSGGDAAMRTIGAHGAGLLSADARRLLLSGSYDEVMKASLARLFSPVPSVVPVKLDPFLLCQGYLESMWSEKARGWTPRGGCLYRRDGGTSYAAVPLDVRSVTQAGLCALKREGELSRGRAGGVVMWCAGSAFHTAAAVAGSKSEINVLSAVSVCAVLLTGFMLFRSFRFVLPLVAAQASAFVVASAALFAVAGRPHVVTFVFGTSLIGLSVDYVFHALAGAPSGRGGILKPLTFSMLTTVAGFAPFVFASAPAVRQMSVFSVAGILAVYAFAVLLAVRRGASAAVVPRDCVCGAYAGPVAVAGPVLLVVVASAAFLLPRLLTGDPSAMYRPDPYLAAGDRLFAELNGASAGRIAVTRGATLQEALENEERAGVKGVSAVVPSLKRQRENAALKARLYAAKGAEYAAVTGMAVPAGAGGPPGDGALLDPEKLPELAWMARGWSGRYTVAPVPADFSCDDPSVGVYSVREEVMRLFRELTRGILSLLGLSLLAMALLAVVLFGRRAHLYVVPMFCGAGSAAIALAVTRTPVTVFSLIAIFVVFGLGVDYTVFYRSGDAGPVMRRTVFFSFLTSFIGLGSLAFTQFPVTRSMGVAFAGGLLGAYLASRISLRRM